VEALVTNLLRWVRASPMPLLVKAMVGHYELVFIHPFTDGNGRVARLWQHVALLKESAAFEFVPVESIIRDRQAEYYAAIGRSNKLGKSTPFLEFSLQALKDALEELMTALRPEPQTAKLRLQSAHEAFGSKWFTRADYLRLHKLVSTATASRDLRQGSDANILKKRGDRRLAQYRFR
jgi:Fic family protein